MTCLRVTGLARDRAYIQIQATCLPLQHAQTSTIRVCISRDEKRCPESVLLLFTIPPCAVGKSLTVLCSCLPVRCHLFAQYLKRLNRFFKCVEGFLGESPDSTLWGKTTLWRGLSPTNSAYLPAPVTPSATPLEPEPESRLNCPQFRTHKMGERVNDHCCFKPLSFRMIFYPVFDNKSTTD